MTRPASAWSRHALPLWFSALGVIGLLRFWMKLQRSGEAALGFDAWLWFGGGLACLLVAVTVALRSARRARNGRR